MPPVTSLPNTIAPTKPAIHRGASGHYFGAIPDQATANAWAQKLDFFISNPQKWNTFANGMASAAGNPKLIAGDYDKSIQSDANVNFPEYMYSHNSTTLSVGTRIPVGFSSKYTQMQADHTGAVYTDNRGFTATSWKEWISRDHWRNVADFNAPNANAPKNTIYFDSMDENDGKRISWQDGHAYTDAEWYQINWSIGDYARSIRPAPGMWAGGNGMKSGSFYMGTSVDPANPNGTSADFPNHLDWALAEDFIRSNFDSASVFPSNSTLEKNINLVKSATLKGKWFWCVVNMQNWAASPGHAAISVSSAQATQWRQYTMAAYLIGNDGNAVYEFVENTKTLPGWNETHPWYNVVLGLPLDNKANASLYLDGTTGLYIRNYELGTVYLNNTDADITFNPGAGFTNVNGSAAGAGTVVPARNALLLYHPQQTGQGGGGGTTAAKKLPPQGTVARNATSIDPSYLSVNSFNVMTCLVNWSGLQDTNTTTLSGADLAVIDAAVAYCRANSLQMVLRVMCGANAPAWLKTAAGTFRQVDVQNYNNGDHTVYTIPKLWTTTYINAYDSLMQLLAARYDTTDVLAAVVISGGGTIFAEPLSRQVGNPQNRAEMVGGGTGWNLDGTVGANIAVPGADYSDAANITALHAFIDSAAKWWQNVNLLLSFSPYQQLLSQAEAGIIYTGNNQVYLNQDDSTLSHTSALLAYFKKALGDRGIPEQNSARSTFFTYDAQGNPSGIANPAVGYGLLYTMLQGEAPNVFYQTANSNVVGDLDQTISALFNLQKANAVELPTDYVTQETAGNPTDWEWTPTNFNKWNLLLQGVPTTPIGTGGGGSGGGYTETSVVHDTFARTVAAGGVGIADTGQTYTIVSGTPADFSVDGQKAVVVNSIANRSHAVVADGVQLQDVHAIGRWAFNEAPVGDVQVGQVWVRVDATQSNGYRLRCTMNPTTSTLTMVIQKVVAGAVVTVGTLKTVTNINGNVPPAANDLYIMELQATGVNPTVLEASFYRQVDGKPATWMDTATDSEPTLQVANLSVGWNTFVGTNITNIPVNAYIYGFDALLRTAIPQNAAPVLSSPSPADATGIQIPSGGAIATVPFSITGTDTDGKVTGVTVQIGNGSPWSMKAVGTTWKKTLSLPVGAYSITYTATDDLGATATLVTSLVISAESTAPPPTFLTVPAGETLLGIAPDGLTKFWSADYTMAGDYHSGSGALNAALQIRETQLGRQIDNVHAYVTWNQWTGADGASFPVNIQNNLANIVSSRNLMISFFDVTSAPADWKAGTISGAYDSVYTTFADYLVSLAPRVGQIMLRLSWEMNLSNWGTDPAGFIAYWRYVVTLMRSRDPGGLLKFVWCPSGSGTALWTDFYPGDAYVDAIGLDKYNGAPFADVKTIWTQAMSGNAGNVNFYQTFLSHGKPYIHCETGTRQQSDPTLPSAQPMSAAQWYTNFNGIATDLPNVDAIFFWDKQVGTQPDYHLDTVPGPDTYPASDPVTYDTSNANPSWVAVKNLFYSPEFGGAVTTPTPSTSTPTPTITVDPQPVADYVVIHQAHDGRNLSEVHGVDLRFGKFIMQPGYISYDLNRAEAAALIPNSEPNAVDFSLQRNGIELLSGEIVSRDADTDSDMVSIAGQDWSNYIDNLYLNFDPDNLSSKYDFTRVDTDLTDIVEGLIQKVLNGYNNTINIATNNNPTGLIQSHHFSATDLNSLKSMIDELANQAPGFEWEITHDLQFIMYTPQRTDQSAYRVDSSNILQIHYGLNGVPGSQVFGRGSGTGSAQAIKLATSLATALKYRDRVKVVDFGTVSSRAMLLQQTRRAMGKLGKQLYNFWITIQPRPTENVFATAQPGQYVYVDYNDGFIILQGWYRLAGYEGFISAAGDEQITLNFNTDDVVID